jgi:hypothetical protein
LLVHYVQALLLGVHGSFTEVLSHICRSEAHVWMILSVQISISRNILEASVGGCGVWFLNEVLMG